MLAIQDMQPISGYWLPRQAWTGPYYWASISLTTDMTWPSLPRILLPLAFVMHQSCAVVTPATQMSRRDLAALGTTIFITANNTLDSVPYRYVANVTVNGQNFRVLIDTGSSDLWIVPPKDFTFNDTGIDVTAGYEGGPVHGTIGFASVELGGYRVDNQAFINATSVQLREVLELRLDGLVGFAFDGTDASDIIDTLKAKGSDPILGDPFLYNVFKQTPDQNNFIGISLSRTGDLEGSADASFTINAVDIAYREVLNAPALPLFPGDNQAWSIVIDGISVDGVDVTLPSSVHTDLSAGKLSVLMDTGNPDTELPTAVLHDIYSKIPGARYRLKEAGVGWTWSIPCNTTSIVTIEIGGQPFPIHPLDLSDPVAAPFSNGGTTCFSPMTEVDVTAGSHFDGSFGDTILRNMYAVYNFGDTISKSPTGNASMQLLSQTDPIAAAADVLKVRMPKLATSASAGSGAVAVAADAADSNSGGAGVDAANVKKYAITIIGLLGAHLVVMLVLTVVGFTLCVKRGGKSARKGPKYSRVMSPTEVDGRPWDSESYDDKRYS